VLTEGLLVLDVQVGHQGQVVGVATLFEAELVEGADVALPLHVERQGLQRSGEDRPGHRVWPQQDPVEHVVERCRVVGDREQGTVDLQASRRGGSMLLHLDQRGPSRRDRRRPIDDRLLDRRPGQLLAEHPRVERDLESVLQPRPVRGLDVAHEQRERAVDAAGGDDEVRLPRDLPPVDDALDLVLAEHGRAVDLEPRQPPDQIGRLLVDAAGLPIDHRSGVKARDEVGLPQRVLDLTFEPPALDAGGGRDELGDHAGVGQRPLALRLRHEGNPQKPLALVEGEEDAQRARADRRAGVRDAVDGNGGDVDGGQGGVLLRGVRRARQYTGRLSVRPCRRASLPARRTNVA
jgi:hypothetical protein